MLVDELNKEKQLELLRSGNNFRGILNDLKRRPEDAAKELGISLEQINNIIQGKQEISYDIVKKAITIWSVNERDFFIIKNDCPLGVKLMTAEESKKSSRIMNRAGKPYYEYRDTAMSSVAPFRPEWIMELCYVEDNSPVNLHAQWNSGHFMHQFTYFIGEVNFYYIGKDGEKKIAIMNTGDSMYIAPFVPHTFTTRQGAKENGLILALTYGNKLTGDTQQELSSLSTKLGSEYALDFSTKRKSSASLLKYFRKCSSLSVDELANQTNISKRQIEDFEMGISTPDQNQLEKLANSLRVNVRELLPNDKIEDKVIVKYHKDCKTWRFPENSSAYQFFELASTTTLPYSKAFEIVVNNSNTDEYNLKIGLHQYAYNIGQSSVCINWKFDSKTHSEQINPGDSIYIQPFVPHNFSGDGKLLVLRIGGKISGDSQRELSIIGKDKANRAISETRQWFNPK